MKCTLQLLQTSRTVQAYRSQIARSKRPHHELFDAKLARFPRSAPCAPKDELIYRLHVRDSVMLALRVMVGGPECRNSSSAQT